MAAVRHVLAQTGIITRLAGFAYVTQAYVANLTVSVGPSMQPTLHASGDILLVESVTPRIRGVAPGDVIVATKPTHPRMSILKRVRRTHSSLCPLTHRSIFDNDHDLMSISSSSSTKTTTTSSSFGSEVSSSSSNSISCRQHHVWLEGDNAQMSTDSRHYGYVPRVLVRSRVCLRVWPPARFGRLSPRTSTTSDD